MLEEGYGLSDLKRDALAGAVVGIVALPLSMALAIAVGIPPQAGLYTAIVAGLVVAALGGSRTQVTGPTAAFVVVLAPIVHQFGAGGLLIAGLMGGMILIVMGLLRLGRLIEFVPYPVTTGFTAGIATVIAVLQVKDLLGLSVDGHSEHFIVNAFEIWSALPSARGPEVVVGLIALGLLVITPKLTKRVPAPLIVLPVMALLVHVSKVVWPGSRVDTIATRFHFVLDGVKVEGIPRVLPQFVLPWDVAEPGNGALQLDLETFRALFVASLTIAMLGAIESLLSAVVADGMARTQHDPDAELIALGVGNVLVPFWGGIAATGAIARTATNVKAGGRSPFAAMTHALTIFVAVLLMAPLLGYLPMASLAALLLVVAWNMSEVRHVRHMLRVAPKSDVAVLLTCFALTVGFDMVVGVSVGMVLASFLFMRRMAEVTHMRLAPPAGAGSEVRIPSGVAVYEISGPLFFGAAQKAMATLEIIGEGTRAVIIDMSRASAMDATGLVAFESAIRSLADHECTAIVANVQQQPLEILRRANLGGGGGVHFCETLVGAVELAERLLPEAPAPSERP